MNLIDIEVDRLIHGLDPVLHIDLALKQLCLVDTGQLLDFANQSRGLLMCDELRGLDTIHQQLQLGQLKTALCNKVPLKSARFHMHDVQTKYPQRLQVVIDTLTLRTDPLGIQVFYDLLHCNRMILI